MDNRISFVQENADKQAIRAAIGILSKEKAVISVHDRNERMRMNKTALRLENGHDIMEFILSSK